MKIEDIWPEWKVEKAIGHGSYGTVFKCVREADSGNEYSAIKVISVPKYEDEYEASVSASDSNTKEDYKEIVDDFSREIKILESLKGNNNIVSIEDSKVVEKEDGIGWQIFIRMELLTDFNTYSSSKKMEREDILKLGTDLCEALKICREKKIIHRDIKPENIFVDEEGNFKLGDFGVAKQLEKTEMSLSRKGTYNYMAPEVFNSKKYDSRADIYSLGLVMYKLLNNNRLPFIDTKKQIVKYSERQEAFEKRIKGEKIPPVADADESLNNLLLRACAFRPDERYRTIEEFEKAVNEIKSGKKLKKNAIHFLTSKKGMVIVSVVLVLAILCGSIAVTMTGRKTLEPDKVLADSELKSFDSELKYILLHGFYEKNTELQTAKSILDDGFNCKNSDAVQFAYNTAFGYGLYSFMDMLSDYYNISDYNKYKTVFDALYDENGNEYISENDPKHCFGVETNGFTKIKADFVDEYLEATFNIDADHDITVQDGEKALFYYDKGYYYYCPSLGNTPDPDVDITGVRKKPINRYEIDCTYNFNNTEIFKNIKVEFTVTAGLTKVKGKTIWRFYEISIENIGLHNFMWGG